MPQNRNCVAELKLNDVYDEWRTNGFFHFLYYYASTNSIEIPFIPTAQVALVLDLEYHGNHSGNKIISCLLERIYDEDFFNAYAVKIAEMFWTLNGDNLLKLFTVYSKEYNPIANYDMTETSTEEMDGTDTRELSGSQFDKTTGKVITTDKVKGFDSSNYADSERSEVEYNDNNTPLQRERSYDKYKDKLTHDTLLTVRKTRSGNIGVTTTQQMLESEINLWQWNFYYRELFRLADKLVTIPVY